MNTYIYSILSGLITLILILISPPERFYHKEKKWIRKFTWRAWLTILFNFLTIASTLYHESKISEEEVNKQKKIDNLEQNSTYFKSQLDKFGLKIDSTSQRIMEKYDSAKVYDFEKRARPILDLCHQGINIKQVNDTSIFVTIPYCSSKNADAYNVQLHSIVLLRSNQGFSVLYASKNDDKFPPRVTISYELGKSIQYSLSPITANMLDSMYFYVKGTYTNSDSSQTFRISDIFKKSLVTNEWLRPLGDEDLQIRKFLKEMNEL